MIKALKKLPVLTPHAESKLCGVGPAALWERIKSDIERKIAQLFALPDDTYMVLRIDRNELVCVALVGRNAIEVVETLIELAKTNQCDTVRFHTKRRGVPRLLKQFNPVQGETAYRIPVL